MANRKGSNTSYHLINEQPLLVSPSLAVAIGLPEAMILQQLHFWLQTNPHIQNGKPYVYNTYKQWQVKFPFWSWETMKRSLLHLEKLGIVEASNFNRNPIDKTKWYTINYEKLHEIDLPSTAKNEPSMDNFEPSTAKNEPSIRQNLADGQPNLSLPIPREIPERSSEENPSPLPPTSEKKKKGSKRCPESYEPSPEVRQWAQEKHPEIDFEEALDAVRDYEFSKLHYDWDATLKTWIRNEARRPQQQSRMHTRPEPNGRISEKGRRSVEAARRIIEDANHGTDVSPGSPALS